MKLECTRKKFLFIISTLFSLKQKCFSKFWDCVLHAIDDIIYTVSKTIKYILWYYVSITTTKDIWRVVKLKITIEETTPCNGFRNIFLRCNQPLYTEWIKKIEHNKEKWLSIRFSIINNSSIVSSKEFSRYKIK